MSKRVTSHLAIVLVFVLWGTSGLFTRIIDASAQTFVFADAVIGVSILLPLLFVTGQYRELAKPRSIALTVSVGFLMTLTGVLFFRAVQLTTITNALLSHYTMPVFVVVLAPFLVSERRSRSVLLALPIAMAGLAIILPMDNLSLGNKDVAGIIFGVASAIFFALHIIWTRRLGVRFSPLTIGFTSFAASAIGLAPFVLSQPVEVQALIDYSLVFLGKGVIISVMPMVLYAWCLRMIEAQRVSVIGFLEPLSAIVLAALIFAEIPEPKVLAGGLLILGAGYWVIRQGGEVAEIVAEEPPTF